MNVSKQVTVGSTPVSIMEETLRSLNGLLYIVQTILFRLYGQNTKIRAAVTSSEN